ncbi:MAG TPA: hypothetical protein VGQ39_21960 [Pyrinomonadaceae bacterium]|jgi:hypothetical protein|nr:hypothetical protein [Pyrinomonadaceae bacterium]
MHFANGWLSFELGVLRRLKFSSVALPFTGEPDMALRLKHWKVRVAANDPMIWSHTKALALIENDGERLSEEDVEALVEDAYMPREKLDNPTLQKWFNEADAWWFDNIRFNAEHLEPFKRALALTAGMMVGDYVLSFNDQTRSLREPLSLAKTFRLMLDCLPLQHDNTLRNKSTNQDVRDFIAERQHTDLLFLRLPIPVTQTSNAQDPLISWREEWLRGSDDFWVDLERERGAKLGSRVQSKQQYLGFVEDLLRTASHIPAWAIAHTENGFISNEELVDKIGRVRKVDAMYSKDFSDLLGVRASIVVATS